MVLYEYHHPLKETFNPKNHFKYIIKRGDYRKGLENLVNLFCNHVGFDNPVSKIGNKPGKKQFSIGYDGENKFIPEIKIYPIGGELPNFRVYSKGIDRVIRQIEVIKKDEKIDLVIRYQSYEDHEADPWFSLYCHPK